MRSSPFRRPLVHRSGFRSKILSSSAQAPDVLDGSAWESPSQFLWLLRTTSVRYSLTPSALKCLCITQYIGSNLPSCYHCSLTFSYRTLLLLHSTPSVAACGLTGGALRCSTSPIPLRSSSCKYGLAPGSYYSLTLISLLLFLVSLYSASFSCLHAALRTPTTFLYATDSRFRSSGDRSVCWANWLAY